MYGERDFRRDACAALAAAFCLWSAGSISLRRLTTCTWSWFIPYVEWRRALATRRLATCRGHIGGVCGGAIQFGVAHEAFSRATHAGGLFRDQCRIMLGCRVHPSWVGVGCLLTTSLFMSIMFPTIFALGLKGMGEARPPDRSW